MENVARRWKTLSQLAERVETLTHRCVCHTDIHGGNLIVNEDAMYILDWEWMSIGKQFAYYKQ